MSFTRAKILECVEALKSVPSAESVGMTPREIHAVLRVAAMFGGRSYTEEFEFLTADFAPADRERLAGELRALGAWPS